VQNTELDQARAQKLHRGDGSDVRAPRAKRHAVSQELTRRRRADSKIDGLTCFVDVNESEEVYAVRERVQRIGSEVSGRFLDVEAEIGELGAQSRDQRRAIWIGDHGDGVALVRLCGVAWVRLRAARVEALRARRCGDDQPSAAQ